MRGVRFNLIDDCFRVDAKQRSGGQIINAAKRLFYGLELLAEPTLQEPIFSCEIAVPMKYRDDVYQVLKIKRGQILEETQIVSTSLNTIKAFLPVSQSFGFEGLLRSYTKGQAYSQCAFDHWENIKGFPLVDQ